MLKSFAKLFAAKPAPAKPARRAIGLEALEDRSVPALLGPVTSIGYGRSDATLLISGTDTNSEVKITQNDDTNRIEIEVKDTLSSSLVLTTTKTYTSSQITGIQIDLKGGKDKLTYLMTGSQTIHDKAVSAHLGEGADEATFSTLPYSSKTLKAGMSFNVDAGGGADTVEAKFGHIHSGDLSFIARMGEGDDRAEVHLQGDVSGSGDVNVELYGQGGKDTLIFDALTDLKSYVTGQPTWNFDLTGDSSLNVKMDGGAQDDLVTMDLDGVFSGETTFWMSGDAGNDTVEAKVNLKGSGHGRLTGTVLGGTENDYLRLSVTGTGAASGTKTLKVDGGDGYDRAFWWNSAHASVLNCEDTYAYIPIVFLPL